MKKAILIIFILTLPYFVFSQFQSIGVSEFERQLGETKAEQLIDIRTPQEFEKYRIKSARNINSRNPNFRKEIETLDKNKPVLIYCLSGARSKAALNTFIEAGFKTVYDLSGGINAWSKAGKSIDQDLSGKDEMALKDYDEIIASKGYVLVDFYAPWCKPCQKMLPIVEDLEKSNQGKFKLLTVDFDQNRLLSKEKRIKSVPHLMVFKNGKKIWEKSGEATKEELIKVLNLK